MVERATIGVEVATRADGGFGRMEAQLGRIANLLDRTVRTNNRVRRTNEMAYSGAGRAIRGAAREAIGFASAFQFAQRGVQMVLKELDAMHEAQKDIHKRAFDINKAFRELYSMQPRLGTSVADIGMPELQQYVIRLSMESGLQSPEVISELVKTMISAGAQTQTVRERASGAEPLLRYRADLPPDKLIEVGRAMAVLTGAIEEWSDERALGMIQLMLSESPATDIGAFTKYGIGGAVQMREASGGNVPIEQGMAFISAIAQMGVDPTLMRSGTQGIKSYAEFVEILAANAPEVKDMDLKQLFNWMSTTTAGQLAMAKELGAFYDLASSRPDVQEAIKAHQEAIAAGESGLDEFARAAKALKEAGLNLEGRAGLRLLIMQFAQPRLPGQDPTRAMQLFNQVLDNLTMTDQQFKAYLQGYSDTLGKLHGNISFEVEQLRGQLGTMVDTDIQRQFDGALVSLAEFSTDPKVGGTLAGQWLAKWRARVASMGDQTIEEMYQLLYDEIEASQRATAIGSYVIPTLTGGLLGAALFGGEDDEDTRRRQEQLEVIRKQIIKNAKAAGVLVDQDQLGRQAALGLSTDEELGRTDVESITTAQGRLARADLGPQIFELDKEIASTQEVLEATQVDPEWLKAPVKNRELIKRTEGRRDEIQIILDDLQAERDAMEAYRTAPAETVEANLEWMKGNRGKIRRMPRSKILEERNIYRERTGMIFDDEMRDEYLGKFPTMERGPGQQVENVLYPPELFAGRTPEERAEVDEGFEGFEGFGKQVRDLIAATGPPLEDLRGEERYRAIQQSVAMMAEEADRTGQDRLFEVLHKFLDTINQHLANLNLGEDAFTVVPTVPGIVPVGGEPVPTETAPFSIAGITEEEAAALGGQELVEKLAEARGIVTENTPDELVRAAAGSDEPRSFEEAKARHGGERMEKLVIGAIATSLLPTLARMQKLFAQQSRDIGPQEVVITEDRTTKPQAPRPAANPAGGFNQP